MLDENLIVLGVRSLEEKMCLDANNNFSEEKGIAYLRNHYSHQNWALGCKYGTIRGNAPETGGYFDNGKKVFIKRKPFPTWVLDENHQWIPPLPCPEPREDYRWSESQQNWIVIPEEEKEIPEPPEEYTEE